MEEKIEEIAPATTPEVTEEVKEAPKEIKEDLLTRASKVKLEPEQPKEKSDDTNPFGLTKEDWDKVHTDPTLSKYYNSMYNNYAKSKAEINEKSRTIEAKEREFSNWTPEKIQALMNNPQFTESAQKVVQTQAPENWQGSQEQWSSLSDTDKLEFQNMRKEINILKQQNVQVWKDREHERLKNKYANYTSDYVDTTINNVVSGKTQIGVEDIWKALDYENGLKRAYELGKTDRQVETKEKIESTSVEGISSTPTREVLKPLENEDDRSYFKRLFLNNLKKK